MNKKSIKSTFLRKEVFIYFLLSLFLVNCSDKFDDYELNPPEPTFSILMAKSWFETNLQPVIDRNLIKPKTEGSSIIDLQPLFNWDLAELYSNSNWAVVELPWEYEEGIVTYVGEGEGFSSGYNPFESNQITKLVILNNLATEEIYGFKMVVLPDINYLALGGDLSNTTYLNQDAEFTGIILFYSVLDQFVNGWIYKNGQITGTLHLAENPDKSENTGIFSKSKGWFFVEFCWYQYFVYPDGSQSEPMLLDCTWESFYVQDFDSQEGGGGFDPGGGGGGGSWGDGNNNENPPPPPNNPCQHVNNLASSSLFQSKMQYLTNYTGLNFEAGYILRDMGNGIINYEYVQGQDGALEINFACGAGNRIRGIIHTHPDNGLPIFSGTDIRVIYNAYRNLCINGLEFVTIGLVTSTGTYLLVVNDPLAFINFGANYLRNEVDFELFEILYSAYLDSNPGNPEKAFLELLNQLNTGLMLFKGNLNDFSQWAARTLNNSGTPVNTKCN